jgi:hypothetical protein
MALFWILSSRMLFVYNSSKPGDYVDPVADLGILVCPGEHFKKD